MDDGRFKQIMRDLGMPDSKSLYLALKQVAFEVAQEVHFIYSQKELSKLKAKQEPKKTFKQSLEDLSNEIEESFIEYAKNNFAAYIYGSWGDTKGWNKMEDVYINKYPVKTNIYNNSRDNIPSDEEFTVDYITVDKISLVNTESGQEVLVTIDMLSFGFEKK